MKSEQLDKYLDKQVEITFFDNGKAVGVLKRGDWYSMNWYGTGYHLEAPNNNICFKKSHVKKIKE